MLKLAKLSKVIGMRVFTDEGNYFGDVEEAMLEENRVYGWKIRSTRDSYLTKAIGGAKGVIVPHRLVRAIGDIVLISKASLSGFEGREEEKPENI